MNKIKFGLLDFGFRDVSMGSRRIQVDTLDYAIHADQLGFSRYWLAEHYYRKTRLAWANPEPLIPLLAASTNRIKIGTAGILLGIRQPFHVASFFKFLNNFFPNRIDLGLANGVVQPIVARVNAGTDDNQKIRESFQNKLLELLYFLRNEDELFDQFNPSDDGVVLPPYKGAIPEIWSLSSSNKGLKRALDLNVNFARSICHQGADLTPDKEMLIEFKKAYIERYNTPPKITIAISGVCQKTDKEVKEVINGRESKLEPRLYILGCVNKFFDIVMEHQETYGIDEFIFKDIARNSNDRLKTLELISDKFNLN